MKIVVNEKLNIYGFERKNVCFCIWYVHWIFGSNLLIESLFINSLIFQVIAVILAPSFYLLYKQENADNPTKYHNNGRVKWDVINRDILISLHTGSSR